MVVMSVGTCVNVSMSRYVCLCLRGLKGDQKSREEKVGSGEAEKGHAKSGVNREGLKG